MHENNHYKLSPKTFRGTIRIQVLVVRNERIAIARPGNRREVQRLFRSTYRHSIFAPTVPLP